MGFFDKLRKKLTKRERTEERMQKIRESGKQGERNFERDNTFSKIKRVYHGADYEVTVRDSAGRERKEKHEVKRNNSQVSKLQKKTHGLKVDRYEKTPLGDVHKTENRNGDEIKKDPMTGKWKKVRKRDSSVFSGFFGSNSSSKPKTNTEFSTKPKRNSLKIWSDEIKPNTKRRYKSSNFLTVGNEDKPKKSSRSNYDSLLGSGSSSRRKKNNGSGFENFLFGSSAPSKRKKSSRSSSASIWGSSAPSKRKKSSRSSSASIWGSSSSSKPKKSSRSNYDSLLGSGSSSRRKKNNGFW